MLTWPGGPPEKFREFRWAMCKRKDGWVRRMGLGLWRMANVEWLDYQWWKEGYRLDRVYGWDTDKDK